MPAPKKSTPKKSAPTKADGIQEVTFVLTEDNAYRVVPVSGVIGGVTPQGMIWADLFLEHALLPETTTHQIDEGKLGVETRRTPTLDATHPLMERRRQVGIVVNIDTAKALMDWLKQKIEAAVAAEEIGRNMGHSE